MRYSNKLIWIDLEMSGLDPERDKILEIATIITDNDLNVIAQGPHLIINQPDSVLENMDEWCTSHHEKSGLTAAVKASKVSQDQAEKETLEFLQQHCKRNTAPLCGNSVWMDKIFLQKHMPTVGKFFHYRIVDVSSIKLVINKWTGKYNLFSKGENHRALDDIKESIAELKYYREKFFNLPDQS